MPRVSYAFFSLAAACGLCGMVWGLWMGATEKMGTYPAHAHLNAVGFLGLSAMGAFHALAGGSVPRLLAWANFWLSGVGAVMLPVGIALIVAGHPGATPLAIVGGMLALAGIACFLGSILIGWSRSAHVLTIR